jgi:hypothetical protein
MWQSTHEMTFQNLDKNAVWSLMADVNHWHEWDHDIEYAKLKGDFVAGTDFTLKPKGGPRVNIGLLRVEPLKGYTDVTKFPFARMYGIHDMIETPQGLKFTITIKIEGPLWWLWKKLVAEKIASEAGTQMKSLAEFSKRKS